MLWRVADKLPGDRLGKNGWNASSLHCAAVPKRISATKMGGRDQIPAQRGRPLPGPGIRIQCPVHPFPDPGFSQRAPAPLRLQLSGMRRRTGDAALAGHNQIPSNPSPRGDGCPRPSGPGEDGRGLHNHAPVFFSGKKLAAAILSRDLLPPGRKYSGPAVITEYSATTVVPPGMTFRG